MKAILIEDEESAAANLEYLLKSIEPGIQIIKIIETVAEAIKYFQGNKDYDIVFMDIHLADGNSFEIVKEVEPITPIIFTTAYDQYAIQAFKLNSIDYLLKPIRESELKNALKKLKDTYQEPVASSQQVEALINLMKNKEQKFRSSFLVQKKDSFIPVAASDFAYFFIRDGVVRGTTSDEQTFSFNDKLENLESDLNPDHFFRVNRQYLIQRSAIKSLESYFSGRLIVNVIPNAKEQIIVSKANAARLKEWLNDLSKISD